MPSFPFRYSVTLQRIDKTPLHDYITAMTVAKTINQFKILDKTLFDWSVWSLQKQMQTRNKQLHCYFIKANCQTIYSKHKVCWKEMMLVTVKLYFINTFLWFFLLIIIIHCLACSYLWTILECSYVTSSVQILRRTLGL